MSTASSVLPFDPHSLPIWQEATARLQQQPTIADARLRADALRWRFAHPPNWQPEPRNEQYPASPSIRQAAVLISLQPDVHQSLHLVLTQRSQHLPDHPGQIAFPGGKIDAYDRNASDAALREAQEEIGLSPLQAHVLGELKPYLTGTGFRIMPVVALLQPNIQFQANPTEVSDIFRVPLAFLMNPANHRKHFWQMTDNHRREWFSIPYTELDTGKERYIWGVTAGILRDFYRFLSA